jgi:hypothetical protein
MGAGNKMTHYRDDGTPYKLEFMMDSMTITIIHSKDIWNSWLEEKREEVQTLHLTLDEAQQLHYELGEILYWTENKC